MRITTVITTVVTVSAFTLAWAAPQVQHRQLQSSAIDTVNTTSGPVTGHVATNHSGVLEYLGIPYGQAPVGDLRFSAPVEYAGTSALNGSAFGFSCPVAPSSSTPPTAADLAAANITATGIELLDIFDNPGALYSEDCLYLNVWAKPQSAGEATKAVMVYIYGGAFKSGSSTISLYNGAALVDQEDVIVVTLNYRLAILGFPGSPAASNNLGLLDQRLAMEWVRENIANFGGDVSRITLFGQSAGSASVDFYNYAWKADPIAASFILESGTAFSFGLPYTQDYSASAWYNITTLLGCGDASSDPATVLECMRTIDVSTIMAALPSVGQASLFSIFGPTVDNTVVFANYSQQTPTSAPLLIGNNDYEAGFFRTQLALSGEFFPDSEWDYLSLAGFACPAGIRANASIAAQNPTWRYRYFGVFPNTNISSEGRAYHGAEMPVLWGNSASPLESTPSEVLFETYMRGAWTAFAKDPIKGLTTYADGWPEYDAAKNTLIRLAYNNLVGKNLALPMLYDELCAGVNVSDVSLGF